MAERDTVFLLDDEEMEETPLPVEPEEEKEEAPVEPEPEKEEPKTEPEPEKDPGMDYVAMFARQQEQINSLLEMNKRLVDKGSEKQEPEQKPVFTAEQWDDDPQGCNEALMNWHMQQTESKKQAETQQSMQRMNEIRAKHQADLDAEASRYDFLSDEAGDAKQEWNRIYLDPSLGLAKKEDGVFRATLELMKRKPDYFKPKAAEPDPAKVKADESARVERVAKHFVEGSGSRQSEKKITLTPEQRQACVRMGVSEQAYIDTIKAMPRRGA